MRKGSCSCSCIPRPGQEFPNGFSDIFMDATRLERTMWPCSPDNDAINYWSDGANIYYSGYYNQFKYDFSGGWSSITWNGLGPFYGRYIWTDGTNIYFSYGTKQYVLNGDTWEPKTWKGLTDFFESDVWTDGTNIYHSRNSQHYVLNKETDTWEPKTWNGYTNIYGTYIWTDGENIYFSYDTEQYVLNGDAWEPKTWSGFGGLPVRSPSGSPYLWTDGMNLFYSNGPIQLVLNGSTWETKVWDGVDNVDGRHIVTDGNIIYLFDERPNGRHILLPSTAKLYQRANGQWIGPCTMY